MTLGKLGVNKLGYQSVGNVLVITTVTTTTTSEPASESSNTAEDVNDEERRRRATVNSAGSATKFSKVLESQIALVILREDVTITNSICDLRVDEKGPFFRKKHKKVLLPKK